VKDCDPHKNCRRCHKRHHQSLCDTLVNKPPSSDRIEPSTTDATAANTTNSIKEKKTILLQTARAVASDLDGSKELNIPILFDSGSQRSYITEAIKIKLGLRSIKKEKLHLYTFGNNKYQTQMCDTVKVLIKKLGGDEVVKVEVLCFPTICTPLPPILEVNHYPGL